QETVLDSALDAFRSSGGADTFEELSLEFSTEAGSELTGVAADFDEVQAEPYRDASPGPSLSGAAPGSVVAHAVHAEASTDTPAVAESVIPILGEAAIAETQNAAIDEPADDSLEPAGGWSASIPLTSAPGDVAVPAPGFEALDAASEVSAFD